MWMWWLELEQNNFYLRFLDSGKISVYLSIDWVKNNNQQNNKFAKQF